MIVACPTLLCIVQRAMPMICKAQTSFSRHLTFHIADCACVDRIISSGISNSQGDLRNLQVHPCSCSEYAHTALTHRAHTSKLSRCLRLTSRFPLLFLASITRVSHQSFILSLTSPCPPCMPPRADRLPQSALDLDTVSFLRMIFRYPQTPARRTSRSMSCCSH